MGLRLDSATDCTESTKYCGARPVWIWCINRYQQITHSSLIEYALIYLEIFICDSKYDT